MEYWKYFILDEWGDAGSLVIHKCEESDSYNGSFTAFLGECTYCGGNWGGVLLTGIRSLWPDVYDAIPEQMGKNAFDCICYTLRLLGVEF